MKADALIQTYTVYATLHNDEVIFDSEDDIFNHRSGDFDDTVLPLQSFRPGTQITFTLANRDKGFVFQQPIMEEPRGFHDLNCIISNDRQTITFINYGRDIQPIRVFLTIEHKGVKYKSHQPLIVCQPSFVERLVATFTRGKKRGALNVAD